MANKITTIKNKWLLSTVLFIILLAIGFICSAFFDFGAVKIALGEIEQLSHGTICLSDIPTDFEDKYNSWFSDKEIFLDLFSITQRVLDKHEVRNFEILKSQDGELYLAGADSPVDTEELSLIANEYEAIFNATTSYGGKFLFVQVPYKNVEQAPELSAYSTDNKEASETYLVQLLNNKGIPTLDLRNSKVCKNYYKTDHHWTVEAALFSSALIADEIDKKFNIDLDQHDYYCDMDNYHPVTYENCFLGSIGIKVGQYYTGKDDFTLFEPNFDTNFRFRHYKNSVLDFEHLGDFHKCFVDQDKLDDQSYNNKYNVNMYGARFESIINNELSSNSYKGLLLSHSYARAMAPYMSLYFKELRYLDPQKDRFEGNVIDYILKYQPDIVILMFNNKLFSFVEEMY